MPRASTAKVSRSKKNGSKAKTKSTWDTRFTSRVVVPKDPTIRIERMYREPNYLYPDTSIAGGYQGTLGMAISLSDLPGSSEFTTLFKQFRITKVVTTFQPRYVNNVLFTTSGTTNGPDNHMLTLGWFQDKLSVNIPGGGTSEDAFLEVQGYRQTLFNKPVVVTHYPKPAIMTYLTPTSTGYSEIKGGWVSTAYPGTPHYGLVVRLAAQNAAAAFTENMCNIYHRVYLEFRGVH